MSVEGSLINRAEAKRLAGFCPSPAFVCMVRQVFNVTSSVPAALPRAKLPIREARSIASVELGEKSIGKSPYFEEVWLDFVFSGGEILCVQENF